MMVRFNRREFIAASAMGPWLVSSSARKAQAGESNATDSFFFIVAADPQLFWGPVELWQKAIDQTNRLKPAFLVVCGDLVQDPGNEEQAKAYLEVAKSLDHNVPLYHLAGNHDVQNQPTRETLAWYEKHFGKLWYSFTYGNCLFVVLESDILNDPSGAPEMADRQMQWLRKILAQAEEKKYNHKIVFKHYPLCIKEVDEPDHYFAVPLPRRKELLQLFHEYHVTAVFSGHYHRNAYVRDGDLELITTSSLGKPLGDDPTGLRIVKVFPDRIEHAYYGFDDLPENAGIITT
ncbi:MAG: metallophosphoesterase [Pirellulales bacterium]|nr:metallophosphoesterase [Pirellulales bacterium]